MSDSINSNVAISGILEDYSLKLISNNNIIYISKNPGIKPLFFCVTEQKSNFKSKECVLYDKVIGLAAARLIVYSNIIKSVHTPTASVKAIELLKQNGIEIIATTVVDIILNKDKSAQCPMEERALKSLNNEEFYNQLKHLFTSLR
jgi:hypothetical protein